MYMSYDSRYSGMAYADFEHLHDLDRQGPAPVPTTISVEFMRRQKSIKQRLGEHVTDNVVEMTRSSDEEPSELA